MTLLDTAALEATHVCQTGILMIYLDHAATTKVRPETRAAMAPLLDDSFGNPSGIHGVSRRAKNALEEAREKAAAILGAAHPLEIVFTGGGTEADNLAVVGSALAEGGRRSVVTTAVEHDAVLQSAAFVEMLGCRVARVGVDPDGAIDVAEIVACVDSDTAVVSVMTANNETGVVFPIKEVAAAVHEESPSALMHTDAVQAFITEPITVDTTGCDMISLAGHKFGGPQGVGLLYVPREIKLEPVVHGGGQELGRRSGTHNVASIVGMVAAMDKTASERDDLHNRIESVRDQFEATLRAAIPDLEITGESGERLVQHSHFRIPGVAAETLLIRLDQDGLAAAAGSACSSGAIEVSHVLDAMGMAEVAAAECVRISFGWSSESDDGLVAARQIATTVGSLR
ncbi:MAG: cysteine desulfurase [bacterium]|nr:cysteine desulfurase [bacterium]MCP4968316.1 cysteine desulfurase [bacterium]